MVLKKFLGILDLISLLVISFHWLMPKKILFYTFFYLFIKGLFFVLTANDFASWLDIGCALYIVFLYIGFSWSVITTICVIYLAQKAILSLIVFNL